IERDKMRVYDALMAVLRSDTESVEVRRRALESIAVFPDAAVAEWVVWGYRSDDPLLRQSALFAMGRSSDSQWLEMVREELSSDDAAMRFEAVNAARELAAEEAVPRLAEMVTDSDRQVVMAAVQALGGIGGAKAKKMLRGLAALSQDEAVREAAEESLQILQTDEADFLSLDPSRIDGQS
ncbi:MAG: HEAT repeat domain-containing protein, partial [Dehalococcoidia bacterium]